MKMKINLSALKIAIVYLLVSLVWIFVSDHAFLRGVSESILRISDIKGSIYCTVIASLLYITIARILNKRDTLEAQLRAAIEEKEMLVREVHHRVKNNLMIVSSILALEQDSVTSESDIVLFEETQARIRSISLVHEHLYKNKQLKYINLADYIKELADTSSELFAFSDTKIQILVERDITVTLDIATSISLILMEALTNSYRHGAAKAGQIEISLARCYVERCIDDEPNEIEITVKDNGPGFPEKINEGLGFRLIEALAEQCKAKITRKNDNGAVFTLRVPIKIWRKTN